MTRKDISSLAPGLTFGVQHVELVVGTTVTAVELRLDGRAVARLENAPWNATGQAAARWADGRGLDVWLWSSR